MLTHDALKDLVKELAKDPATTVLVLDHLFALGYVAAKAEYITITGDIGAARHEIIGSALGRKSTVGLNIFEVPTAYHTLANLWRTRACLGCTTISD